MKPTLLRTLVAACATVAGTAAAAEITVFKQPNFAGEALTLRGAASNLANRGFHDQISSIAIKSGRWEVCTQPDFKGDCTVLERGDYPTLQQSLNHRIESVREVTRMAEGKRDEPRYADNRDYRDNRYGDRDNRYGDRGEWRANREPAIELYGGTAFRGRSLTLNRDEDDLLGNGYEPRVSSLVINEGRWQLCTDPGFQGECRVFDPGRYPQLGRLNNQIASVRRIG